MIQPANQLFMEECTFKMPLATWSRRDFIKLLAGASFGFGLALVGLDRTLPSGNRTRSPSGFGVGLFQDVRAAHQDKPIGSWTLGSSSWNTGITAIHIAMLNSGKILTIAGSSFNRTQSGRPPDGTPYTWQVYNPSNGSKGPILTTGSYPTGSDPFSCHLTQLADGKVFICGGTALYDTSTSPLNCNGDFRGIKNTWIFNPANETLTAGPNMREGRWYPTCLSLPDGRVILFAGDDGYGTENQLVEIYNPSYYPFNPNQIVLAVDGPGGVSSYTPDSDCASGDPTGGSGSTYGSSYPLGPEVGNYPRMHLMPSGLIIFVGMQSTVRAYNPAAGSWQTLSPSTLSGGRYYGSTFLLPLENDEVNEKGKILIVGGSTSGGSGGTATGSTQLLTFTGNTTYQLNNNIPGLNNPRKFSTPIILPDGLCVLFGGNLNGQSSPNLTYIPEVFDPQHENYGWVEWEVASVPRTYHQTSVLLPDGRVCTMGGTPSTNPSNQEKRVEFFNPWYTEVSRPSITSVTSISSSYGSAGGTIVINTPDANDIDTIHGVSLLRLMAETHHFDPNQRLVWLQILSRTSNSITAKAPVNANFAPPGPYLIHVLDDGVPSPGKIITFPGTSSADQTTPTLTIASPSGNQVISGPSGNVPIDVVGSASDSGSGIQAVEVRLGSLSWQQANPISPGNWSSWSKTLDANTSGANTIQARAIDNSGNSSTITIPIRVAFI